MGIPGLFLARLYLAESNLNPSLGLVVSICEHFGLLCGEVWWEGGGEGSCGAGTRTPTT